MNIKEMPTAIAAISAAHGPRTNVRRPHMNLARHLAGAKSDAAMRNTSAPLAWLASGHWRKIAWPVQVGRRRWSGPAPA